jgi:hypothetical protein
VYWFIFAHEISHLRFGPRCGYNGPLGEELAAESTCDRIGFDSLASHGYAFPHFLVASLAAMHAYEALMEPLLTPPGSATAWRPASSARDWRERATAIMARWDRACQSGNETPMCRQGWREEAEYTRQFTTYPPPSRCNPTAASASSPSPVGSVQTAGFGPALSKIVANASSGFRSLRGSFDDVFDGDSTWAGTLTLPGMTGCAVWSGPPPRYRCTVVETAADAGYQRLKADVTRWVSAGWTTAETRSGNSVKTTRFAATRTNDQLTVAVILSEFQSSGRKQVKLSVESP